MKNLLLILVMLVTGIASAQINCNPLIQDVCDTAFDLSEDKCIADAKFALENDEALQTALDNGGTATTSSTRKDELEGLSRNGIIIVIEPAYIYEADGSQTISGFNESYTYNGEIILDKYDAYAETRGNYTNLGDLLDTHYKEWHDTTATRVRDLVAKL